MAEKRLPFKRISAVVLVLSSLVGFSDAYRSGDIVLMSKSGQYHSSRTLWEDVIGRNCPVFAVNREALLPIQRPAGYTGADPYKLSFQVGHEKFLIPWLFVINRKSSEVPMIDVQLKYSGNDLHGVTAKVVDMPHHFIEVHPDIRKQFWTPEHWPKHVLIRYTWIEQSEVDVLAGFYVLFGSGLLLSFVLAIYVLQSSHDKLARFVRETVAESGGLPGVGGIAKVE
ncbi:ATP-dependent helicase/deoxyribonuclease subunit B [Wolffia australiana]